MAEPFEPGNFTYYETITSTSKQYRAPYNEFTGKTTAGSAQITDIGAEEIAGFKVGDRITGPGIVSKDSVTFVGETTTGSNVISNVSSGVIAQLAVGETISGQSIPQTTITALGANSITVAAAATATSATNTIARAERRTKITSIGTSTITVSIAATATATAAALVDGWADPTVPEYHDVTTTKNVITSANAMHKAIAGNSCETILWLAACGDLVVGTTTGERIVPSGANATAFSCKRQSAIGSAEIQPVLIGSSLVFIGPDRESACGYLYDAGTEAYQSPVMTALADHILESGVRELDYQGGARPILWATREDGVVAACSYSRIYDLAAWFTVAHGGGAIESLAVIPIQGVDTVYAAVNDGASRRVQKMGPVFGTSGHLDSAKNATVADRAVTGLTHLNGEACLAYNGAAYTITITSGSAQVPDAVPDGAVVQVGLRQKMRFESMPLHSQAQMIKKTIFRAALRLLDSYPFDIGCEGGTMERAVFDAPFSGDHMVDVRGVWDTEGSVIIEHDDPFDLTILAIAPEVDVGG